jgi:hypothetical protein
MARTSSQTANSTCWKQCRVKRNVINIIYSDLHNWVQKNFVFLPYILVGIATGYGLDGQGSIPGRCKRFFSSSQRPDRLWGLPSPLSIGYQGRFTQG